MPRAFSADEVDRQIEQTEESELSCRSLFLQQKLGFATYDTFPETRLYTNIKISHDEDFLNSLTVAHGPVDFV